MNLSKIKTIKTLERELLKELETQDFKDCDYSIFEAFTEEENKIIKKLVYEKLIISDRNKHIAKKYISSYEIDMEEDEETAKYYLFMEYLEYRAVGKSFTFAQFLKMLMD